VSTKLRLPPFPPSSTDSPSYALRAALAERLMGRRILAGMANGRAGAAGMDRPMAISSSAEVPVAEEPRRVA